MPDLILAAYLLFVLPGMQLWKTLRKKKEPAVLPDADARRAQLYKSLRFVLVPVFVMVALLAATGRGPGTIGLDIPVSVPGMWGLAAAGGLLLAAWLGTLIWERSLNDEKTAKYHADLRALEHVPQSSNEMWAVVVQTFCMGVGWELLYRGFLMLVLVPLTGTAGAVMLSAVAYGAGHGYVNPKQFIGSIVSAFLFTIGYVATHSLWWLMLLHVLLPLFGICSAYFTLNKARKAVAAG